MNSIFLSLHDTIQDQMRKTPEQMDVLRKKFVAQAQKYIGVPYHPRYHKSPSSPHYNAPLYLDCCGLTRRCLQDLADDFGFVIGRGNQAYQFETCPIELKEEDLKPGDLIFTEGTYTQEGKKQCKHNMVHVEIWLGGGESGHQTIGARRQTGAIEILPHYKFESKNYTITNYYLRSLDTWLSGECKPLIDPKHWEKMWSMMDACAVPGGKSVFDAADDDDNDEIAPVAADRAAFSTGDGVTVVPSDVKSSDKVYYCGKGNNWKVVGSALEKRGYKRLPFEYGFSDDYHFKWVEGRSAINFSTHKPGQLVNHIPNNDVITNKLNLFSTISEWWLLKPSDSKGGLDMPGWFPKTYRLDAPSDVISLLKDVDSEPATIFIHKPAANNRGRGIGLVKGAEMINKIVYKPNKNPTSPMKSPMKTPSKSGGGGGGGVEGVAATSTAADSDSASASLPLPSPSASVPVSAPVPVGSAINVIQSRHSNFNLTNGLIQKYISNPLLVNGRKFDIRSYCLVARTEPTALVYYGPGYARLSLEQFTAGDDKIGDNFVHLTNAAIQKKHPDYKEKKEETIWSMEKLSEFIGSSKGTPASEVHSRLEQSIKNICSDVYSASSRSLSRKLGYFDLLGFDLMLDEDLNVFLLEVNTNPALHCETEVQGEVIPGIVDAAVGIVLKAHEKEGNVEGGEIGEDVRGAFELIFEG